MTNKLLGAAVLLLGLALLFRVFLSGSTLFLIVALLLALASGAGLIGRTGYVLAGIFLLLAFGGFALRSAFFAVALLLKLAPLLVVLVGIYLLVKAFNK